MSREFSLANRVDRFFLPSSDGSASGITVTLEAGADFGPPGPRITVQGASFREAGAGGRLMLTEEDLAAIVALVRGWQDTMYGKDRA